MARRLFAIALVLAIGCGDRARPRARQPERSSVCEVPARDLAADAISMAGTVRTPDGRPVAGAVVAANHPFAAAARAVDVTDETGRFQLDVPEGRYALTVTAEGHAGVYREPFAVSKSEAPPSLELTRGYRRRSTTPCRWTRPQT